MSTLTAYAPTDVASVSVGTGCGQRHDVIDGVKGGHGIDCPICGPALLAIPSLGWAGSPQGVKLTVDENAALEEAKATGLTAQALAAKSIGEKIASLVMAGKFEEKNAPVPEPEEVTAATVLKALENLPQDQLAALLKQAGLAPADDLLAPAAEPQDEPVTKTPRARKAQA